ncbi:MauE/DoxX family redox-associated membrane protein [Algoriphagus sp.]|uniref:MauE/DoxX family redox-associated membrane protein n=1 Tax=Algoriphagus sp. TaxID=1872435 RepID=UPI0025E162DC|nr:MauE/DoxX family redox-associated membrane protein [Algoriphagus sp.]
MKIVKKIIGIILALLLLLSGIAHFMNPEFYFPLIPDYFPKPIINHLAGIVEILLGIGVFIPSLRKKALFGIFILMIIFLPIHILDALKENPAIGTKTVALVRIAIQLVLIYLPWFAMKE